MAAWTAGAPLGPYVLLGPLGAGGMGEVWKARDTRLNRIVAVKRLKGQHGARFEQEARAIAALNHPHICQIHDLGPDYLVLEYIEGHSLKGPQTLEEAVRLAAQIAEALEAAHRKGVVHRDLKPANIMVTSEGSVKLLDFGLAKQVAPASAGEDATQTMAVMGTPAYMAPEQAEGKPADQRSDVFSFGAVLYEVLSGRRPFESLAAAVRDEAAPLQSPASDIVKRCLAKRPADRFQSMAEVRAALEALRQAGDLPHSPPSIAVLPFANMSRDADDEFFSDGLAEEIINALAQVTGLKVIARTSAFAFKGKNEDIRKIAETLGVTNVLEGSVRRSGSRLRITAQLIHAADGTHLWSQRYDREMTDVFAVQDEIAAAIADALKVKLAVAPAALRRYTPNLPAYEAYLKARYLLPKANPESLARCKECYEQAIALDPGFALAHVGLADHFFILTAGWRPAHENVPLVRACARKALDLDPLLPEAHAILGGVAAIYDYDWKEAERLFRLAMAREPVSPQVHCWYGFFYLLSMGRTEDAVEELKRAVLEDPLNLLFRAVLAGCLMAAGRFEDALTEARRILELDENSPLAYSSLAANYAYRGLFNEALPLAEKACSLMPWNLQAIGTFAAVLQRTGNTKRAEEVLQKLRNAPEAYGAPRGLTMFHLLCGEIDQAADWFEKAIEQRDPAMPGLGYRFRSSPRWPALAKLMNLPS
jgi:TolB-like protein/predicted Ser/Thr protein kinase